jgi:hypothetical protein
MIARDPVSARMVSLWLDVRIGESSSSAPGRGSHGTPFRMGCSFVGEMCRNGWRRLEVRLNRPDRGDERAPAEAGGRGYASNAGWQWGQQAWPTTVPYGTEIACFGGGAGQRPARAVAGGRLVHAFDQAALAAEDAPFLATEDASFMDCK